MTLFGLSITRRKNVPAGYSTVESSRSWFPWIGEAFAGAWQRNLTLSTENILTYSAVYACVTLKASDIAKLRIKLVQQDAEGVWTETSNPAYSPVLHKPNHFQTRQQFLEQWMASKYIHGNTYVLLQRNNRGGDGRGNVSAMYVLDPQRVRVLVTPGGEVYYALSDDTLSGLQASVIVPASEIVHDRMTPFYHPLVGVSPLTACGAAAMQGLRIQGQSSSFFAQGSLPSGVLEVPDELDDAQAREIQRRWEEQFSGNNAGKVAALGAGWKYTPMTMRAVDAQLIEQLKWTAENVCTAHHVPPYMVGVGAMPTYNNIEALWQQYYAQALQADMESVEALLDVALGVGDRLGAEFDLDGLLRMDTQSRMTAAKDAVTSGMTPDEVRRKFHDLGKVDGGDKVFLQKQNWPLTLLGTDQPTPAPQSVPEPVVDDDAKGAGLLDVMTRTKRLVLRFNEGRAA